MPVTAPPRVHRARHSARAQGRAHLTAVPPQRQFVATVTAAGADAVARDAQRELVALGHDLHDGPVQSLIAASLALQLAERAAAQGDDSGLPRPMAEAREALTDALQALRATMTSLDPPGVQGGLGQMLAALRARAAALTLDDRATGAVSAEIAGAVFRLLAALGATDAQLPRVAVTTRDRPGVVLCEVRLRGTDAAERSLREEVERALRRLHALGARAAVARATGGADLLLALPADTTDAPSPALTAPGRPGPAHLDSRGTRRTGGVTTLAPTGTEDWR